MEAHQEVEEIMHNYLFSRLKSPSLIALQWQFDYWNQQRLFTKEGDGIRVNTQSTVKLSNQRHIKLADRKPEWQALEMYPTYYF